MLVIRDVSFQSAGGRCFFLSKVYTAEQTITDQALNSAGAEERGGKLRNETLLRFNKLIAELSSLF